MIQKKKCHILITTLILILQWNMVFAVCTDEQKAKMILNDIPQSLIDEKCGSQLINNQSVTENAENKQEPEKPQQTQNEQAPFRRIKFGVGVSFPNYIVGGEDIGWYRISKIGYTVTLKYFLHDMWGLGFHYAHTWHGYQDAEKYGIEESDDKTYLSEDFQLIEGYFLTNKKDENINYLIAGIGTLKSSVTIQFTNGGKLEGSNASSVFSFGYGLIRNWFNPELRYALISDSENTDGKILCNIGILF